MTSLNPNDPNDLLFGSAESLADYLGVSAKTVKRWKNGAPLPEPVRRLLVLRLGDLSGLLGSDWSGFYVGVDGLLYPPFFRGGFGPLQIAGMFFEVQELRHLRRENKKLCLEVKTLRTQAWAADKVKGAVSGILRRDVRSGKQGW